MNKNKKESIRAFVAIEIPEDIRSVLAVEAWRLREKGGRVSWVKTDNMHLTLRFFGEVSCEQLTCIRDELRSRCREYSQMRLAISGLGAFPKLTRPSVIWVGVKVLLGDLLPLQKVMEEIAQKVGLTSDPKPFHPHITLGRVRDSASGNLLAESLAKRFDAGNLDFGDEFVVRSVALWESELRPGGPVYTCLEEFPLG